MSLIVLPKNGWVSAQTSVMGHEHRGGISLVPAAFLASGAFPIAAAPSAAAPGFCWDAGAGAARAGWAGLGDSPGDSRGDSAPPKPRGVARAPRPCPGRCHGREGAGPVPGVVSSLWRVPGIVTGLREQKVLVGLLLAMRGRDEFHGAASPPCTFLPLKEVSPPQTCSLPHFVSSLSHQQGAAAESQHLLPPRVYSCSHKTSFATSGGLWAAAAQSRSSPRREDAPAQPSSTELGMHRREGRVQHIRTPSSPAGADLLHGEL